MPRTRGVRTALALGLVALALSACTKHREGPPPLSSADFVTSPSASATERPMPQVPAAAKVNSPEGAEAFVRYVIGIYGYVYEAQNTAPLDAISGSECSFCKNVRAKISDLKVKGHRRTGSDLTAVDVLAAPDPPAGSALFSVTLQQGRVTELDADGHVVATDDHPLSGSFVVAITWEKTRWRLFDISFSKSK